MFMSYAFFAVLFGEEHLEDEGGATALGIATWVLPIVIGLSIAALAHFGGPLPSRTSVTITLALVGLVCFVTGAFSVTENETDASIGGAFLIIFGLLFGAAAWALRHVASETPPAPPPPSPIKQ